LIVRWINSTVRAFAAARHKHTGRALAAVNARSGLTAVRCLYNGECRRHPVRAWGKRTKRVVNAKRVDSPNSDALRRPTQSVPASSLTCFRCPRLSFLGGA
jgi:hypothetical protein